MFQGPNVFPSHQGHALSPPNVFATVPLVLSKSDCLFMLLCFFSLVQSCLALSSRSLECFFQVKDVSNAMPLFMYGNCFY